MSEGKGSTGPSAVISLQWQMFRRRDYLQNTIGAETDIDGRQVDIF